ncbi:MFS transporter [Thalassobaculum sp. OXR-137]|uniref:MFS transporter n=1 Tax=Thalassobaculum sp. OXR-137 TaxID=3100173 RepID=UPI002AC920AA|nr:MFS transporter [Thalassobaculum sp. OXR-137]WPZ32732.1 MFS transporter [Thalassobaculum sp. OXR-137]
MKRLPELLANRLPFFYGWVVLGVVCCVSFARQGPAVATLSIFVDPMTSELGWSRTAISAAVSVGGLLAAVVSPGLGPLVDRHGARSLLAWAVAITGICCIALAGIETLVAFYLLFCVARMNFAGPFDLGIYGAINNWFVRLRPIATSISTLWLMIGLTSMPLIAHAAMTLGGDWRWGWIAVGTTVLVVGFLPTVLLLARRPEDVGQEPDGGVAERVGATGSGGAAAVPPPSFTRAEAMREPAFWLLLLFTFLAYPVQAGVSLHQAPHLVERGLDPTTAAFVVSTFSATSGLVGFLIGPLVRPLGTRVVLFAVGGFLAAGSWLMTAVDGPAIAFLASALFGCGIGGLLTVPPIAWADTFGRHSFGAIRGVALSVQVTGQAVGPVLSGALRDWTGSYQVSLQVFMTLAICAATCAVFLTQAGRRRT